MMQPDTIAQRPLRERIIVVVYAVLLSLTVAHAVYYTYATYYAGLLNDRHGLTQQQYYRQYNSFAVSLDHPFFSGQDHAPGQYRIGVELPVAFVARLFHMTRLYQLFSALDFLTGVATCLLLYTALCRSDFFRRLEPSSRKLAVALLLATFVFPFSWVVSWIRPETIPSSLYLALALYLIERVRTRPKWLAALLAATLWQSFTRPDIAAILGLAILVFAFAPLSIALFNSRRLALFTGASILTISIAVQALLKFVIYPHATYAPDGKPFVLFYNLQPRILITFVVALLPCAVLFPLALRLRRHLDPSDLLAILASCLYLPLWLSVGILVEVRIFVPFFFLLTPTAAKLLTLLITESDSSARSSAA